MNVQILFQTASSLLLVDYKVGVTVDLLLEGWVVGEECRLGIVHLVSDSFTSGAAVREICCQHTFKELVVVALFIEPLRSSILLSSLI